MIDKRRTLGSNTVPSICVCSCHFASEECWPCEHDYADYCAAFVREDFEKEEDMLHR